MEKSCAFDAKIKDGKTCPFCGGELVDDFCHSCNKFTSDKAANIRLKEKYPYINNCPECKSGNIVFNVEKERNPAPKNALDIIALSFIHKYDEKYPEESPEYREFARCNSCGNKWYIDGYKDTGKLMGSLRKTILSSVVLLLTAFLVVMGSVVYSLFAANDKAVIRSETTTSPVVIVESTTENFAFEEITTAALTNTTSSEAIEAVTTEALTSELNATESPAATSSSLAEPTAGTTTQAPTEQTTIPTTQAPTAETPPRATGTVYITPYGEKYHLSAKCAGKNAMARNYNDIKGSYGPCKKCAQ